MRVTLAIALTCLLGIGDLQAQTKAVPHVAADIQISLAPVAKGVTGSVVNVLGTVHEPGERNPYKAAFHERYFAGEKGKRVPRSLGSGVMLDASGLIVTNNHVVEELSEIRVRLADRREFSAKAILRDPRTDLAVLKLEGEGPFEALPMRSADDIEVGDLVVAVGYPMGLAQTVTQGIVSGLARTEVDTSDSQFFIQTDAAINPGNSGGALVDVRGRLLGINTAIFSLSGGSDGVGFAIPADLVRVALDAARSGRAVMPRPWLGARVRAAETGKDAKARGVLIRSVVPGGPAAASGLRQGDTILAVDGRTVDSPEALNYRLWLKGVAGTVPVEVQRGAETLIMSLGLSVAPEARPRAVLKIDGRSPLTGVTVANSSPAVADEVGVQLDREAVIITEVNRVSPAHRLGFRRGDLLLAVDGEEMRGSQELQRVLRQKSGSRTLTLRRDGRTFTRTYPLDRPEAVASAE
jgi:S1-C subfamily serine protease